MKFFFILLFSQFILSQSKNISGLVSDDNGKPLEYSNIIAKPLQEKASLKFAIADNNSHAQLNLLYIKTLKIKSILSNSSQFLTHKYYF
ncbi:MAG: hypothetical protein ACOVQC_05715 [Flavobacterium sp.]